MGPSREPDADDAPEVLLADVGRAFFEQFQLAELSKGLANYWNLHHASLTEPTTAELARRWGPLHVQDSATREL